jgi:hypothetical protein
MNMNSILFTSFFGFVVYWLFLLSFLFLPHPLQVIVDILNTMRNCLVELNFVITLFFLISTTFKWFGRGYCWYGVGWVQWIWLWWWIWWRRWRSSNVFPFACSQKWRYFDNLIKYIVFIFTRFIYLFLLLCGLKSFKRSFKSYDYVLFSILGE